MQPFVDHATAVAALRSIATSATSAADGLAAADGALVFKAFLDAIDKDGAPPFLDMALTCIGGFHYADRFAGFLPFVNQLAADGKIPAPPDPAVVANLTACADVCDLHRQDFANMGQAIRDFLATPGLMAALAAMGGNG